MSTSTIVQPLKAVYDTQGNPIALSEFQSGDYIPKSYLMLDTDIDGGTIADNYPSMLEFVDGGAITDNYTDTTVCYNGGPI